MVNEGTIIRVDFEAYTEDGELFDTTKRDVAVEEHGHAHDDETYEPMPVIVGDGRVVQGFDEALLEADVGEEVEVEVPPEKGFGERDSDLIETYPKREFEKRDQHVHPGMRVRMGERQGTVSQVTAGRVRVDFNPPLAGDTLRYTFTITEVCETDEDKVRALIDLDYQPGRSGDFTVEIDDGTATITVPDRCKYDQRWFVTKYRLVADIRQHTDLDTIRFLEVFDSAPGEELDALEGDVGEELEDAAEELAEPAGVEAVAEE